VDFGGGSWSRNRELERHRVVTGRKRCEPEAPAASVVSTAAHHRGPDSVTVTPGSTAFVLSGRCVDAAVVELTVWRTRVCREGEEDCCRRQSRKSCHGPLRLTPLNPG